MFTIILFLTLTKLCQAQQLQINNIDTDHGYLLFSDKPIQIPSEYEHHCLRINLLDIDNLTHYFNTKVTNYTHIPQIKLLHNKMLRELNAITLHQTNRQKRGLINIMGSAFKYLFGTLDNNDRIQIHNQLESATKNSINIHEMSDIIQLINSNMQKIKEFEDEHNNREQMLYELIQFTEYIEDIAMGMQLSRLGLFNPKLLNYDKLENVDSSNILQTKTSTWINTNQLLIIAHIPTKQKTIHTINIIPYPDNNGYQLDHIDKDTYFEEQDKIYNQNYQEINNECIKNIIKRTNPICNFVPITVEQIIKYVEPNSIITWNLNNTIIEQKLPRNK